MDQITNSLQKIGLSENEARTYIALTKIGDATVKDIANEAGMKRPTTYLVLDELRQKGLILKIPHVKKAIYRAKDIDDLYDYATDNINEFKRALPKLESLSTENKPVKALYFEGIQGMKDALFYKIDELENKTITLFGGKDVGLTKTYLDLVVKWGEKLENKNINIIGVTPNDKSQSEHAKEFPELYKNIILIPSQDYSSEISIDATDEFVRFVDGVEMKAVIIESERMAKTIKDIFKLTMEKYDDKKGAN